MLAYVIASTKLIRLFVTYEFILLHPSSSLNLSRDIEQRFMARSVFRAVEKAKCGQPRIARR